MTSISVSVHHTEPADACRAMESLWTIIQLPPMNALETHELHIVTPSPMVLLLHKHSSEKPHFDWMLAQDREGEKLLISFRSSLRIDMLNQGETADLERIADHRPRYLTYQGSISSNRGAVTRVSAGMVLACKNTCSFSELRVQWDCEDANPRFQLLRLVHEGGSRWQISHAFPNKPGE